MFPERPQRVSVIDPIEPTIERVRLMLFEPFDLSKWFTVGFCAWLAYLGQGGSPSFNYRAGHHHNAPDLPAVKEALLVNLPWVIIGAAVLIPIFVIVGLILCWLRSRGQFMFVHCIAGNKAEVAVPWKKFARQGNSLFLFKIIFGLIAVAATGLSLAIAIVAAFAIRAAGLNAAAVSGLVVVILAVIITALLAVLIVKFADDFVVPIMFLRTAGCLAGWREFLAVIACNKARFAFYILFQLVISLAIIFIIATICLVGCCCCCASVLLFVPYVGTVILLPIIIFKRAYSLFYLRQFGLQFDVFQPA